MCSGREGTVQWYKVKRKFNDLKKNGYLNEGIFRDFSLGTCIVLHWRAIFFWMVNLYCAVFNTTSKHVGEGRRQPTLEKNPTIGPMYCTVQCTETTPHLLYCNKYWHIFSLARCCLPFFTPICLLTSYLLFFSPRFKISPVYVITQWAQHILLAVWHIRFFIPVWIVIFHLIHDRTISPYSNIHNSSLVVSSVKNREVACCLLN